MEKRDEIIAKAGALFMLRGIKSVSMDDLARELGISKKTIYIYFEDKNDIIENVLSEHLNGVKFTCEKVENQGENAIIELYNMIKLVSENTNRVHPSVFYDLQKYHPNAWNLILAHEREFVLPMFKINIERGRKEGLYRDDFDVDIVSQIYVTINDAIFQRIIQGAENQSIDRVFKEALEFILFGVATFEGKEYIRKHIKND